MLRHPIYLLLCAASCSYVLWANARGYSPFFASSPHTDRTPPGARLLHK